MPGGKFPHSSKDGSIPFIVVDGGGAGNRALLETVPAGPSALDTLRAAAIV